MTIHHDKLAYGKLASTIEDVSEARLEEMLKELNGGEDDCENLPLGDLLKACDRSVFTGDGVTIKPVGTDDDIWYAAVECGLTAEQRDLVNPAGFTFGRAYLKPQDNFPCIICDERGERIGFINFCKWLAQGEAYSWSYFIDVKSQGNGYGRRTAKLAIKILRHIDCGMPIKLAAERENIRAHALYKSLGFKKSDELDGDDFVFVYE